MKRGYPLENRSYQSDDINYKFTGKQRDAETGYDYFGARYYGARIGRWGSVEPLLEKYIAYSPYQYGLLNPMKLVDTDGKDVIVTIVGNTITFNLVFYYSTSSERESAFNTSARLNQLNKYINQANTDFNNAAKKYNDNKNHKYNVVFNIKAVETKADLNVMFPPEGENTAMFVNKVCRPGISNGNILRVVPDRVYTSFNSYIEIKTPTVVGDHEAGHAMGATHIGPEGSEEQTNSTNYMSYNMNANPPDENDIENLLKKVDYNKPYQVIEGDKTPEK